jgi:PAS domain S-box-containing protein
MADYLVRQRDYLLDISLALTSQLSLSDVLRRILEAATRMLGGEAGLIALADGDASFNVRASYGIKPALLHFFAPLLTDIPRSDPQSFRIPELDHKMRLVAQAAGLGLHQVIALPMVLGPELVGVVYIFRAYGGSFGRNEVKLLQSFANQAAIAVQNARLYEQVSTEKRRLDAILRHSGDGIMIIAADMIIESINLTLSRITGCQIDEAAGKPHDDLVQWAKREPGMDLSEAIAGGWPLDEQSTIYVEGDLRRQDIGTISVGITYAPLFDQNGQLRNVIANVRDITKFRAAEEAKSTFISVVSHELKTPVSLIKGYASTLRREDTRWDQQIVLDGLTVIEEEADRLTDLIENLLDASRLQAGNLQLHIEPIPISKLVDQVVEKFKTQSDSHTFNVHKPAKMPLVLADEKRLTQVMANLLGNAIKYSPQGGNIEVGSQINGNREIEVWVTDEGIGIEPGQEDLIFDRFYRVDNALSRETQGAGLGLYIVRSIIQAHGGSIWAEKGITKGSSIHFTLPISPEQSSP